MKQATIRYSGVDGIDGAAIAEAAATLVNILSSHWPKIKAVAEQEDSEGKIKVAATLEFDFNGKKPGGAVNIAYVGPRVRDGAAFNCDPPEQMLMVETV